ncbi:hypothetical protein EMCRGX_G012049 [Ephydatia muelleri]
MVPIPIWQYSGCDHEQHVVIAKNCAMIFLPDSILRVQFHVHTILSKFSHAHKATVMCVKWNHNGNWLTSADRDHPIKIFDIRTDVNIVYHTHTTTHTYTTHTHTPHTYHTSHHAHTHHTHHTYRGGIIWYGFTLTKTTITGIGGKEACVPSMSTEGSAAMLISMTLALQKLVSSLDADEEYPPSCTACLTFDCGVGSCTGPTCEPGQGATHHSHRSE